MFWISLLLTTAVIITKVTASCPVKCQCPAEPPVCPAGVSMVPDGCGCCKVCAAQLNQDCHPLKPCDHHKGLQCNHGNDVTNEGICRAKTEGRTCEYNGRMYQHGESFRAGCKHQCSCIDGAVGCTALCNNKLPPATPSCPYPRLTKTQGKCCYTVDCHKGTWHLPWKNKVPPPKDHQPRHGYYSVLHKPNKELHPADDLRHPRPAPSGNKHNLHTAPEKNIILKRIKGNSCPVQTTGWSQCSRSCGLGVSTRISNKNLECKLQKETRICTVRPCLSLIVPEKKLQRCSPTQKAPGPLRLSYGECVSVRLYRPNYCSVCAVGRCCSPRKTRTVPVTFACPNGERFQKSAMFIQSCKCSNNCSHLNEVALPPQHWMFGDTHKFID